VTPEPLISCIMPTRNRPQFVPQAVWYFLRQDYERRELVVVDDGRTPVRHLLPDDERIRYLRLDRRATVGEKRNIACQAARGELIAHWDDDDWMSPRRLTVQVGELAAAGADVCGLRELLHYRLEAGEAWLYRAKAGGRPWVAGGTLVYHRSVWERHRFPQVNVGEDLTWVQRLGHDRVRPVGDGSLYLALIHRGNTAAKNLAPPRWERRSLDEVRERLSWDREFYGGLRNGRQRGRSVRRGDPTVTVSAPFAVYDGYGSMAQYLVRGMARAGANVNVLPTMLDRDGLSPEVLDLIRRSRSPGAEPVLYFCWPRPELERFRGAEDLFINTMWEASRLPADWPERLNRARAVIVPTRFVADVCRASGVTVPIEVVPEGVDPGVYSLQERPERDTLTTLMVATVVDRKNTLLGIAAWQRAFAGDPTARLVIKSRFGHGRYDGDDPRIEFIDACEHSSGIAHYYRRADVLMALGNEGFGLPLVEGMATGLPVVALSSEGQSDVCHDAGDLVLAVEPATWKPHVDRAYGSGGVRGVPSVETVAARLRWVADHRDEAREVGAQASAWALAHRDIWDKGPAVLEVMERRVARPRPLRRQPTMWVPTLGGRCGVAEDAASLAAELPGLRLTATAPDLRGTRVLHVQYEPSTVDELELGRVLVAAARHGVPAAVTEHVVLPGTHAFERDARALVSTTRRGAEMLRGRWPGKLVEHIPIGCPTWFPPRKRARGGVIGVFGFLERHKGFWALLDVLRALPGTELLMFSYAKSPTLEAEWERAAAGLPVRRVGEFLPAAEVARRLAAEADVLAYPYEPVPWTVASGAVRVGLATGVPILATETDWFAELDGAVHRSRDLVAGAARLLEDTSLRDRVTASARELCEEQSWTRIAGRHEALWQAIATT
jgi:glycosyltransferase involved in cell wall biosynthesis